MTNYQKNPKIIQIIFLIIDVLNTFNYVLLEFKAINYTLYHYHFHIECFRNHLFVKGLSIHFKVLCSILYLFDFGFKVKY